MVKEIGRLLKSTNQKYDKVDFDECTYFDDTPMKKIQKPNNMKKRFWFMSGIFRWEIYLLKEYV